MKNWSQFTRRVIIDKPIDEIFKLWSTGKGLETWFLKTARYTGPDGVERNPDSAYQVGDQYHWEWHQWDGHANGKVLEQNGTDRLKFEFESSIVEVEIEQFIDGRSLVTLIQSNIEEDDKSKLQIYCGCSCGWTFWLTNLKAWMEHGILLNESGDDLRGHFDGYQLVNT